MTAAQSCVSRWVIIGRFLGNVIAAGEQVPWHHGSPSCNSHAVDEIAASDVALHSQFAVVQVAQKASESQSLLIFRKRLTSLCNSEFERGLLSTSLRPF